MFRCYRCNMEVADIVSHDHQYHPDAELRRYPDNNTGIFLHTHTHDWVEVAAHQWPNGQWEPVWRCAVCTDVICTRAALSAPTI